MFITLTVLLVTLAVISLFLHSLWRHYSALRSIPGRKIPGMASISLVTCMLQDQFLMAHPRIGKRILDKYCRRNLCSDNNENEEEDEEEKRTTTYPEYPGICRHTIGDTHWFLSADPEVMRQVLLSKFSHFDKVPWVRDELNRLPNVFTSMVNEHWHRLRKLISPAFSDKSLYAIFETSMQSQADVLVEKWMREVEAAGERGALVNVSDDMAYYAMDVITSAGFGEDVRAVKGDQKGGIDGRKLTRYALDIHFRATHIFFTIPPRLLEIIVELPIPGFLAERKLMNTYYMNYLHDMIRRKKQGNVEEMANLVREMVNTEIDGQKLTDKELVGNANVMYTAGAETTKNALSWCMHFISALPHVQKKLQQEVDDVMQRYDGKITVDAFENEFRYLRAVIHETLRLKTPGHQLLRRATRTTTLRGCNGVKYNIPDNSFVVLHLHTLYRDRKLFGDNADRFDPERWFHISDRQRNSIFFPFSMGKRFCVGRKFAEMEMILVVAKLVHTFRFQTTVDKIEDLDDVVELTLKAKNPIKIIAFKR